MPTEVWFRNPQYYIIECVEEGVKRIVWDEGILKKRRIDLRKFMELHYRANDYWYAMSISHDAARLVSSDTTGDAALFPVWEYGNDWQLLENMVKKNCADEGRFPYKVSDPDLRPIEGQAHRVVLTYLPELNTSLGKKFFVELAALQEDYPETIMHVHGLYSYRAQFGLKFGSTDVDVRGDAAKGNVILPNGKKVKWEDLSEAKYWCQLMSFDPRELVLPRNRCIWNIRAAMWAGQHFADNVKFRARGFKRIDPDQPLVRTKTNRTFLANVKPLPSDKYFCNVCSLQNSCRLFRIGAVCAVPGSEPKDLSDLFGSREPEVLKSALNGVLQMEAVRIKEARQAETEGEKLDPEVTRMLDRIFSHGERLLKLVDPALRPVGAPQGAQPLPTLENSSPAQLAKAIIGEFMALGVPAESVTPQLIMDVINAPGDNYRDKIHQAAATLEAISDGND